MNAVRVLVGMSGGVDSSVAAALLLEQGHEVVGATLKLWGGASDSGCCSVADVDDARRVAQQLGVAHHVFSFTDDFDEDTVDDTLAEVYEAATEAIDIIPPAEVDAAADAAMDAPADKD